MTESGPTNAADPRPAPVPDAAYGDAVIEPHSIAGSGPVAEAAPLPPPTGQDVLGAIGRVHENIKFADQKATFLIGLDLAVAGFLFQGGDATLATLLGSAREASDFLLLSSVSLAGVAIGLCLWTVRPRGGRRLYERLHHAMERPDGSWRAPLMELLGAYARINDAKFDSLRAATYVSGASWLLGFLGLIFA
jgi:hypothetical protein